MKIDELIDEIQELKKQSLELKDLKEDKKKMADKLYEYELNEYNQTSVSERKEKWYNEWCLNCRKDCKDKRKITNDVYLPIRDDRDYFPAHKGCKEFDWD